MDLCTGELDDNIAILIREAQHADDDLDWLVKYGEINITVQFIILHLDTVVLTECFIVDTYNTMVHVVYVDVSML